MPMYSRIKIAKRVEDKLPMVQPGIRDNSILPSSGGASNSGITLDYSAINMGGIDNGVAINHANDMPEVIIHEPKNDGLGEWLFDAIAKSGKENKQWTKINGLDNYEVRAIGIRKERNGKLAEFASPGFQIKGLGIPEYYLDVVGLSFDSRYAIAKFIKDEPNWPEKLYDKFGIYLAYPTNAVDDDNSKANGSFVGSKEEGFAFRHNLDYGSTASFYTEVIKIAFPDWQQYNGNSQMYEQVAERTDAFTTPHFNLWNTYYTDDTFVCEKCEYKTTVKKEFDKHVSTHAKKSWLNLPQYSEPERYELVGENPHNTMESEFNIFETYFADDEINTVEDSEDIIETYDVELNKQAFLKTAVTYDSNPVIQELIKIPEVKALIDQEASGYVDKIVVTTTGADIQQTQQQLSTQPQSSGIPPITLQPISGNPYGHVWISEDPTTHQKKPLDRIVRIDRVTDAWGTLVTILHEIAHHRHPDWSESQVESEAINHANTVKQHLFTKTASSKTNIVFVKQTLHTMPMIQCDLADTYQKQVIGLQSYSSLKPQHGLLFTYKTQQPLTFWMGKVSFPIDIIFANKDNRIVKIYRNCQPKSAELYSCDGASKVIEVVGSFCAFHDIDIGDHVFYADDRGEDFTKYIFERIKNEKLSQQKDLDMTDWNIKIVMKKQPDSRRFLKVSWTPEDYKFKKADILVNPDPTLIRTALEEMPLDKLVRHALLHILAGAKNELPEDREQKLITNRLY